MSTKKISELTAATTISLSDTVPIVQGGTTKKATLSRIGTATTTDADADILLAASGTTKKPFVLQLAPSQTANGFEVQNSTGAKLFAVAANGTFKDAANVTSADVQGRKLIYPNGTTALDFNSNGDIDFPKMLMHDVEFGSGHIFFAGGDEQPRGVQFTEGLLQLYDTSGVLAFKFACYTATPSILLVLPTVNPDTNNNIWNNSGVLCSSIEGSPATLPTSNPNIEGRFWNDAGTVKVSAGP